MVLNRVHRGFALLFVVGFLLTYFCSTVYCQGTPASRELTIFNLAKGSVDDVEEEIKAKVDEVTEMVNITQSIESAIAQITQSGRMNALQAVAGRFSKSPVAVVMALANQINNTTTALDIVPSLESLKDQIDIIIDSDIDIGIYQRAKTGYNVVWDRYITAYGNLSGQDLQSVNLHILGENDQQNRVDQLQAKKKSLPNPELLTVKVCNGTCGGFFHNAEIHKETCVGCGDDYYVCDDKEEDKHLIRYCGKQISFYTRDLSNYWYWKRLGICGAKYRTCDDPAKKGVHYYYADPVNGSYNSNSYLRSYTSYSQGKHDKGTTSPPAVSIYGPNGVGFADDAFDNSPTCDTCICEGSGCPDAATNHPRTYPDAPDFSLTRGAARGSIELRWTPPASDGNSPITDYQYKMEYFNLSQASWVLWCDWTSAGTDMYELVTGLHSKAYHRVSIRSENGEGTSQSWYQKQIKTK